MEDRVDMQTYTSHEQSERNPQLTRTCGAKVRLGRVPETAGCLFLERTINEDNNNQ